MTKNEYIASIMLEAADLLKEDNQQESLNEGIGSWYMNKQKERFKKQALQTAMIKKNQDELFKKKNNSSKTSPKTLSKKDDVEVGKAYTEGDKEYSEAKEMFKKAYNESTKIIKSIINSSDNVNKAFKVSQYSNFDGMTNYYDHDTGKTIYATTIVPVEFDLTDFYPEDARERYRNNNTKEFDKVYDQIVDKIKPIAKKYGLSIQPDGDWDTGCIVLVKKGVAYL